LNGGGERVRSRLTRWGMRRACAINPHQVQKSPFFGKKRSASQSPVKVGEVDTVAGLKNRRAVGKKGDRTNTTRGAKIEIGKETKKAERLREARGEKSKKKTLDPSKEKIAMSHADLLLGITKKR